MLDARTRDDLRRAWVPRAGRRRVRTGRIVVWRFHSGILNRTLSFQIRLAKSDREGGPSTNPCRPKSFELFSAKQVERGYWQIFGSESLQAAC